jgi:predicted NBD/HSP70 family sugar kinase
MTRESAYCFAADLGGTKLAAAIADARGRIVAELTLPTEPRGGAFVAEQIAGCAGKLAEKAGIGIASVRAVVVGVPGAIDPRTSRVSLTPNVAGLDDFDVLKFLRERFGPDVAIENDVNLAMLGEQALGCASGCRDAAFFSIGTGAGLGLLLNNQLFRGARGAAGEIADLPIGYHPASPSPPGPNAFELEVASLGIGAVLDTTAHWVALAVVTLQSLLDLELIVFGGSIGVRPELYERVERALPALFSRPIRIARSRLGDRAGLMGAVCAAARGLAETVEPRCAQGNP